MTAFEVKVLEKLWLPLDTLQTVELDALCEKQESINLRLRVFGMFEEEKNLLQYETILKFLKIFLIFTPDTVALTECFVLLENTSKIENTIEIKVSQ